MKTTAKMITLVFLLSAGTWLAPENALAHRRMHHEIFYNELRPYGNWMDSPDYGFVWVPNAEPGFHPYSTGGYWSYTSYGWTWVSTYSWGWAPFHYGRWYYDNWYGWVWVPGNEWAPAWVSWRNCDGYYGWAPLSPGFNFSVTVNVHVDLPYNHWVFLPGRHFGSCEQEHYYMDRSHNERLFTRSRVMETTTFDRERNTRYYRGPAVNEVSRITGRTIKPTEVRENERPRQNITKSRTESYRPRPVTKEYRENVEKRSERKYTPPREDTRKPMPPVRNYQRSAERQKDVNPAVSKERVTVVKERVERKVNARTYTPKTEERRQEMNTRNTNPTKERNTSRESGKRSSPAQAKESRSSQNGR